MTRHWLFCILVLTWNPEQKTLAKESEQFNSCTYPIENERFWTMVKELSLQGYFNQQHLGVSVCTNMDRQKVAVEPQIWQDVKDRQVKVFSAFYEDRPLADGPAIRIIGVGWQAAYNDMPDIFCNFWYDDLEFPVGSTPALYKVIYPSNAHHDMWCSHFIICKLPSFPRELKVKIPYSVTVGPSPCHETTNELLVLNREAVTEKGQLGLCVSPIYNYFKNWTMIVEMFEMYKILGVEKITTYNFSMIQATSKALQYYTSAGEVSLVQWRFPKVLCNVFGQRAALNDCLYRMGHKHQYVIIVDLDELIVPRATDDLIYLMEYLNEPQYGSYLFQHAYFKRNHDAAKKENPYLITMTSFERTNKCVPGGKVRSKPIFVPEKTISIDLHYAYLLVKGYKELVVPEKDGFLHHYRSTPMESFAKKPQQYTYIEDRRMEKYKAQLLKAYNKAIRGIDKL